MIIDPTANASPKPLSFLGFDPTKQTQRMLVWDIRNKEKEPQGIKRRQHDGKRRSKRQCNMGDAVIDQAMPASENQAHRDDTTPTQTALLHDDAEEQLQPLAAKDFSKLTMTVGKPIKDKLELPEPGVTAIKEALLRSLSPRSSRRNKVTCADYHGCDPGDSKTEGNP
eukprot:TRINITY_DN396_c0_g1_i4.p1 TRINITY_DN396_c0_g1~~TRINITY_DN396_c0_g1_i4.p1  ORF type:complete len:168 (-),score=24.70 TRINITY_DN396_c0_g1_i4:330-833(-)